MRDALDRLYKTKLQLLAVLSTLLGIILLLLTHLSADSLPSWLQALPLTDVGSALFTTGLLAVAFEYLDRKDGDERANQRLRQVLREEAPAIRQAVLDGLAFSPDGLKAAMTPEVLDRITRNALELRLGDGALAEAVYGDVRSQIIENVERWQDLDVDVSLSPWSDGPAGLAGKMFVATIRTSYRTVPGAPTMRFACVSDTREYRELLDDPGVDAWYFQPVDDLDGSSPEAFQLLEVIVDGTERPIRRTKRKGIQIFSVAVGEAVADGKAVQVMYTYRALVQRAGHLLYLDIPRPTNGLKISLNYAGSGIRYVSVLDFVASSRPTQVLKTPSGTPARSVDVSFDGWVFAKSGVAFVWVLESEVGAGPSVGTTTEAIGR